MKKTFLTRPDTHKRVWQAKRNALFSPANISWGLVALIAVTLLLVVRLVAPNFFLQVFTPVFRYADSFTEIRHTFFNSFKNTTELVTQNERLVNENIALTNENQTLRQEIKSISGLKNGTLGIIAGVVARPPESPYDTLVIAEGSKSGVALGMRVFGEDSVPLGTISSVSSDFSRVTLFSSPGVTVNGWVGHVSSSTPRAEVPITINGGGASTLNASAPRSANITAGDTVFASGPGMLPIGTVVRVDSDQASPSVTLHIMPAINIFSISWVTVRDVGASLP